NFSAAPTLPTGCALKTMVNNTDTYESAFVAVCPSASSGTYTVTESLSNTGSSALGAYVFPPQNVIFDDNIPNGKISTAGLTLSSGSKLQILGTNTITALPPANFVFSNWQISNTINLTLSSTVANPATLTVFGSGTVTANYNGISKFVETGLPSATTWNVIYDGILNSSTTNTITFSTPPGNYLFTVANQVVSGTTYIPSPSSGYLVAGNTTTIKFTPLTCTISLSSNTIEFGSMNPSSIAPTTKSIIDDNTGNTKAYMFVYGYNWTGPLSFGVSNTTWSAVANTLFSSAKRLTNTPTNTSILVPAGSSNTIYFGLGIPGGTPPGSYSQNIVIENSC
ncbi:MAG: hypothetical protein QXL16_01185, partial [Candidatus Micrarchaeaceae archaeon]